MPKTRCGSDFAGSIQSLWRQPTAPRKFQAGVSLHSHTAHSKEYLTFIPRVLRTVPSADALRRLLELNYRRRTGRGLPYERAFWRPPLNPRDAFELEASQIRKDLGLDALVSLTDHDNFFRSAQP